MGAPSFSPYRDGYWLSLGQHRDPLSDLRSGVHAGKNGSSSVLPESACKFVPKIVLLARKQSTLLVIIGASELTRALQTAFSSDAADLLLPPEPMHDKSPLLTKKKAFAATNTVLLLLCLMYFLTYIDRVNVSTASNIFEKELHLNKTEVGFIFSAFAYPYLLFQIFGGYLGDRFGPRKVLTICSLIWAASTILTGLTGGFVSMVIARMLLGFGEGATFPTATSAMSSWTRPVDRGFAQGLTHSFSRVGNSLTPPMVVALMALTGWRGSFIVLGIVSCLWVVVWYIAFRDNPADHPRITQQELSELPAYVDSTTRLRNRVPWQPLVLRMLPVTFVYFCYGWTLWLYLSWLPQYFKNQYHLELKDSALFAMSVFFAGTLGDALGGVVSDLILRKTKDLLKARRNLVVVCFLCSLVCMIPMFLTTDLTTLVICLASAFFFAEMTIGPMWAIPMDIAPRFSGSASGIMNCGSALAAILSPVVFGYIIDTTHNWTLPFIGSMGLFAIGSIVAFWMKPDESLCVPVMTSSMNRGT
jgi:MFS family permease